MQKINPFLWFNDQAEEAAKAYVSIFRNSRILNATHYGKGGPMPEGLVMTVEFELEGQRFVALNGGPHVMFTPAISFVINCDTQQELDSFWDKLSEGGDPQAQQCGWLKDRFGVSWQVVPSALGDMLKGDGARAGRVMQALMPMRKLDIAALRHAYDGA